MEYYLDADALDQGQVILIVKDPKKNIRLDNILPASSFSVAHLLKTANDCRRVIDSLMNTEGDDI